MLMMRTTMLLMMRTTMLMIMRMMTMIRRASVWTWNKVLHLSGPEMVGEMFDRMLRDGVGRRVQASAIPTDSTRLAVAKHLALSWVGRAKHGARGLFKKLGA